MRNDTTQALLKMTGVTGAGWVISLEDVEEFIRIASLVVPMVLSVLVYLENRKKNKRKTQPEN